MWDVFDAHDAKVLEDLVDGDGQEHQLVQLLMAAVYVGLRPLQELVLAALALLFRPVRQVCTRGARWMRVSIRS